MAIARSYDDPCGIARALDLVGERWALLVVRELVLGPKRFVDLRGGLGKLSANVLAQRLRELEDAGLVTRCTLPPPAGSRVYELTERGRELEPVLLALGRWGSRAAMPDGAGPLGADAVMLALSTRFDAERAGDLDADYDVQLGADRFRVRLQAGRLDVSRDTAPAPGAVVETDPATLAGLLWHGGKLVDAERAGTVRVAGDRPAVERLLTLFPPAQ